MHVMKKVLVPTDFSASAKKGVMFAIQWATQQKIELIFIHVLSVLRPTRWSDAYYEKVVEEEENNCRKKFEKHISNIYTKMNVKPGKYSLLVIAGISADVTILDFCRKNPGIDAICISTRGAGKFNKILGTNTGNLITKSAVPVLAVPQNYRVSNISTILYATDFKNYEEEMKKVVAFAKPLKAKIDILHISWPTEIPFDEKTIEQSFKKQFKYDMELHMVKTDATHSVKEQLEKQTRLRKPSLLIMFTKQKRTFFEKLFFSSNAESMSFQAKVPMLVFNKTEN